MLKRIPSIFKNFYFLVGVFFLCWIAFIDSNDLLTQYRLGSKLTTLEEEKAYYTEKIDVVKKDREELLSDQELLEKFAREKYLMKKPTEDIFVVVEEEN
jgi:cell division protein FtsB